MSTISAHHRKSAYAGKAHSSSGGGSSFSSCGQPALEGLTGARIADVLRLWDTECKTWLETGPVIVRLEPCDLAIAALHGGHPSLLLGSIDTETPAGAPWIADSSLAGGLAIWMSYRPLSTAIGSRIGRATILASEHGHELSVRLPLEEGETLLITGCSNPATTKIELAGPTFRQTRGGADYTRAAAS